MQFANVTDVGVSAQRAAAEANSPLVLVGQPECEFGVEQRPGQLGVAGFDVDAGVSGFDVREAGRRACPALGRGGVLQVAGTGDDTLQAPAAVGAADEVDAGRQEFNARDLDTTAPEGGEGVPRRCWR